MTRLVVPPPHKGWLYPILKPLNNPVVIPSRMGRVWDHNRQEFVEADWNLAIWDTLDPRGFRYNDCNCSTFNVMINGVPVKYLCHDVDSFAFTCCRCGKSFLLADMFNDSHKCKDCASSLTSIGPKSDPGWEQLKKGTGPYFGIELEMVHRDGKATMLSLFNKAYRHLLDTYQWELPAFVTDDCSLAGHGYELNFHPMGMDYFTEHESKFVEFFTMLKEGGGSHLVADEEKAGIHIHITKRDGHDFENNASFINTYARTFLNWFVAWSGRSLENFKHWNLYQDGQGNISNTYVRHATSGYALFAKRNSNKTLEYRGYSTKRILDNPSAMKDMMRWVSVMEQASLDYKNLMLTPHQLAKKFDPTLVLPYVNESATDFPRLAENLMQVINSGNIASKVAIWHRATDTYFGNSGVNSRSLVRWRYVDIDRESRDLSNRATYFRSNNWYYARIREYGTNTLYLDPILIDGSVSSNYVYIRCEHLEVEFVHMVTLHPRIVEGRPYPGTKPTVTDADKIITDEMCVALIDQIKAEQAPNTPIVEQTYRGIPVGETTTIGAMTVDPVFQVEVSHDDINFVGTDNTNSFRLVRPVALFSGGQLVTDIVTPQYVTPQHVAPITRAVQQIPF